MLKVKFYDTVDDQLLEFAVIVSRMEGKWIFCQHKERETLEIPGGHREKGETILETAKRELKEETGAEVFSIQPVCVYSVVGQTRDNVKGNESFGMLYYADIQKRDIQCQYEIKEVYLLDSEPWAWTYPEIQPLLWEKVKKDIVNINA